MCWGKLLRYYPVYFRSPEGYQGKYRDKAGLLISSNTEVFKRTRRIWHECIYIYIYIYHFLLFEKDIFWANFFFAISKKNAFISKMEPDLGSEIAAEWNGLLLSSSWCTLFLNNLILRNWSILPPPIFFVLFVIFIVWTISIYCIHC